MSGAEAGSTPARRWLADQGRWLTGDVLRFVAAASVPLCWAVAGGPAAAAMLLALGGAMALRFARMPTATDLIGQAVLLAAAWWAATGAYEAVPWLDLVTHAACGAVLALLAREIMLRTRMLPVGGGRREALGRALHTSTAVLLLGFLWELGEWAGHALITDTIRVGYEDTLSDLLTDLAGAIAAAILVELPRRSRA
ncbi:hypothetical protein [Agrococcus sp. Marseille-P2731]|uniref:hypothetical protein n=1 Tax=Agrococcus sp. Marseille-P2731 TaxID=1841862 RepID=UPI0009F87170|nr:hypothetical protein [Agrococcus sp. Marseille-P2731]